MRGGLTDEEIFALLLLILPAGVETTYQASGNLLVAMLTEPPLMETVRADRGMLRGYRGGVAVGAADQHRGAGREERLRAGWCRNSQGHQRERQRRGRQPGSSALSEPGSVRPDAKERRAPDIWSRSACMPGHAVGVNGVAFRSPVALPVEFTAA
jgi:hypothetical protein